MKVLERRPILLGLAGPNGAGKSTFYDAHLRSYGLRYVNADALARELDQDPYKAAESANRIRKDLLAQGESFAFETVFVDPVGEKLEFMKEAVADIPAENFAVPDGIIFVRVDKETGEPVATMRGTQPAKTFFECFKEGTEPAGVPRLPDEVIKR